MRSMSHLCLAACVAAAVGCHAAKSPHVSGSPTAAASQEAAPASAVPRQDYAATVLGDMERTADPCDDFYRYACGEWLAKTEIPADEAAWGRGFSEIEKRNEELLRDILEQARKDPGKDADLAKLGRYYGACMDEEAVERAGAAPLAPWLKRIETVRDADSLMQMVGELHRSAAPALFDLEVEADFKNPEISIAFLTQGGLGLFDRDYYLKDDAQSVELRKAYTSHVAGILRLLGEPEEQAKANAERVLAFETELAKISRPRVELRDPEKNYNRVDIAGLKKLAPTMSWDTFFTAIGSPGLTQIAVGQPEFYQGLADIAAKTDPDTLREYLRWQAGHFTAPLLSRAFVDEDFSFYGATLSGQKEIRPRWKRCVSATDAALGELLGRFYIARAFPGDSKQSALDLIHRVEAAFRANLDSLSWMDPATRERAVEKLEALSNKIGYPDTWRDYSALRVEAGDYYGNAIAARAFEVKRLLDKVGKPVDKKEWGMTPPTVNAYYNPLLNEMVFPAGIMQPPFFKRDYPAPMNFGGIGMVMGHELTHGYDDDGRKFDPKGRLHEWWDPSASERFEAQAKCVSDLYSTFEAQPGVTVNGELTLGENIADFGGIKEAYHAWKGWEREKGKQPAAVAGLTNDQLFFVGFAQTWCTKMTPELERLLITLDTHAPPKYRVNAPLSNFPAFAQAFDCKVGAPMKPEKICTVW